ncbi:MAG: glutamine-hydrolyzing GMP synthase [Candidatus Diapherotrites archaeon]
MQENKILVVDLGGQYAHLIARRVRELGVYSEILDPDSETEKFKKAKGIILSGSPASICDTSIKFNREIYNLGIPILGICYGHQMFARDLGGSVEKQDVKEFGTAELEVKNKKWILEGLNDKEIIWMSHHDKVGKLPKNFELIATSGVCNTAAMADFKRNFYGLQFHPEVTHTPNGMKIFENFVFKICKCKKNWSMENYIEEQVAEIKKKVGNKKVFLLASGGVDSTVALALVNKAIGKERIYALHVDTGFMRKNEIAEVKTGLKKMGFSDFHVVDASEEYFEKLKGVIDPEEKRKIIGDLFIEVKEKELEKLGFSEDEWILAQGTIYPDTIESAGTKHADRIKTHHNRVELVQKMIAEGKVIEPLSQLYKDEVRELGEKLGLPNELVWRHPFPGPGLAIRALCYDGKTKETDFENVEEKAKKIIAKFGCKMNVKVLPLKSVGVQGDLRTYRHPIVISGSADWETIEKISTALTNSLKEINRVMLLVKPSEIKEMTLIHADLNKKRMDLLREADAIAMQTIQKRNLMQEIWQFPTVLLPVGTKGKESIVLRPVESKEAMTVSFYKMDEKVLEELAEKIMKLNVSAVFYDVTNKPPATIEWE